MFTPLDNERLFHMLQCCQQCINCIMFCIKDLMVPKCTLYPAWTFLCNKYIQLSSPRRHFCIEKSFLGPMVWIQGLYIIHICLVWRRGRCGIRHLLYISVTQDDLRVTQEDPRVTEDDPRVNQVEPILTD